MSALNEALSRARRACESATEEELMAFGRAINSIVWDDDLKQGAVVADALFKVPFGAFVARTNPEASLDQVLAIFAAVMNDG